MHPQDPFIEAIRTVTNLADQLDAARVQRNRLIAMLVPLCDCPTSAADPHFDVACPLHGDGETFTSEVAELRRAVRTAR